MALHCRYAKQVYTTSYMMMMFFYCSSTVYPFFHLIDYENNFYYCSMFNTININNPSFIFLFAIIRHYDTTSWLEYSLDREKLTKDNSQPPLPPHHQHHINNNNNLHNNIKLQRSMDSNNKMGSKLFPTPLRPISGPNSDHYSFRTPIGTKSSIVDIDQCQLVQSFMKHDQSGKQYLENMKKDKKHDGNNDLKKKKIKKDKMLVEKPKKNLFKRNNKIFDEMNERRLDTLPFFPPSLSSLSSTTKLTDISGTNRNLSGMRKEYETQTLELNLTGSDDGDSHTNLSIDEKIYERIANPTSVNTNTTLVMQIPTKRSPSPPIQSTRKINEEYGNIRKSRQLIPPNHITNNNYLPNGFNYHKSVKPQSTSGVSTLSKNPLYNEIRYVDSFFCFNLILIQCFLVMNCLSILNITYHQNRRLLEDLHLNTIHVRQTILKWLIQLLSKLHHPLYNYQNKKNQKNK